MIGRRVLSRMKVVMMPFASSPVDSKSVVLAMILTARGKNRGVEMWDGPIMSTSCTLGKIDREL